MGSAKPFFKNIRRANLFSKPVCKLWEVLSLILKSLGIDKLLLKYMESAKSILESLLSVKTTLKSIG